MKDNGRIDIKLVEAWDNEQIVELIKAGGWWKEYMDPSLVPELIGGSYLFAVAVDETTGKSVGMGRVISDGIADAYVQDLVVLSHWRNKGIGKRIVSALIEGCQTDGITWIGLIAQPGTDAFYRSLGFETLRGYKSMLFQGKHQ